MNKMMSQNDQITRDFSKVSLGDSGGVAIVGVDMVVRMFLRKDTDRS